MAICKLAGWQLLPVLDMRDIVELLHAKQTCQKGMSCLHGLAGKLLAGQNHRMGILA